MNDENGIARFEDARAPLAADDVDTAVRALLHQGVDRARIPLMLANTRGYDPAVVERAIARADDETRARDRTRLRAAVALSVAVVGAGAILDATLGTSRAIGAALLMGATGLVATLLVWLLRFHK